MRLKVLGENNPDTASSCLCLAQMLKRTGGEPETILELARRAFEGFEASGCHPDHPQFIASCVLIDRMLLA